MAKRISRKQVNRIYVAYKNKELDFDYRVINFLYENVADHEFNEENETYITARIALDYLFDNSDLGPVYGYPEIEKRLNALIA